MVGRVQIATNIFRTLVNGWNIKVEKVILLVVLVGDRNIKMEKVTLLGTLIDGRNKDGLV